MVCAAAGVMRAVIVSTSVDVDTTVAPSACSSERTGCCAEQLEPEAGVELPCAAQDALKTTIIVPGA